MHLDVNVDHGTMYQCGSAMCVPSKRKLCGGQLCGHAYICMHGCMGHAYMASEMLLEWQRLHSVPPSGGVPHHTDPSLPGAQMPLQSQAGCRVWIGCMWIGCISGSPVCSKPKRCAARAKQERHHPVRQPGRASRWYTYALFQKKG